VTAHAPTTNNHQSLRCQSSSISTCLPAASLSLQLACLSICLSAISASCGCCGRPAAPWLETRGAAVPWQQCWSWRVARSVYLDMGRWEPEPRGREMGHGRRKTDGRTCRRADQLAAARPMQGQQGPGQGLHHHVYACLNLSIPCVHVLLVALHSMYARKPLLPYFLSISGCWRVASWGYSIV
jgi:hypothetical protein